MMAMEDLVTGLPHVLGAPKDDAPVTGLCFRPAVGERIFPDALRLTRAEGVPGDRWLTRPWLRLPDGSPHPAIQVSVLPQRVLDLVWRDRTQPHPGDPVIADMDMSEANLPVGTLLRVGTAVIRVSDVFNDGCVKWKVRYGADAKNWIVAQPELRLRGILCSVEQDGEVWVGDRITKL
ncbi:MOSC domain-containing protein [Falsirhodobacter deserti]|uniref:MOSC domain-containing protein n=1 Tax=Falsirhodobacter deserti TaxID=1365611 RepID=UPI000FE30F14|nr:hypothetical protein [Falsirhodobacter deserti]